MSAKTWFNNLPDELKLFLKSGSLSTTNSGGLNLNISPETLDLVKRFGISSGVAMLPIGLHNLLHGNNPLKNHALLKAMALGAGYTGATAAWPHVKPKVTETLRGYLDRS